MNMDLNTTEPHKNEVLFSFLPTIVNIKNFKVFKKRHKSILTIKKPVNVQPYTEVDNKLIQILQKKTDKIHNRSRSTNKMHDKSASVRDQFLNAKIAQAGTIVADNPEQNANKTLDDSSIVDVLSKPKLTLDSVSQSQKKTIAKIERPELQFRFRSEKADDYDDIIKDLFNIKKPIQQKQKNGLPRYLMPRKLSLYEQEKSNDEESKKMKKVPVQIIQEKVVFTERVISEIKRDLLTYDHIYSVTHNFQEKISELTNKMGEKRKALESLSIQANLLVNTFVYNHCLQVPQEISTHRSNRVSSPLQNISNLIENSNPRTENFHTATKVIVKKDIEVVEERIELVKIVMGIISHLPSLIKIEQISKFKYNISVNISNSHKEFAIELDCTPLISQIYFKKCNKKLRIAYSKNQVFTDSFIYIDPDGSKIPITLRDIDDGILIDAEIEDAKHEGVVVLNKSIAYDYIIQNVKVTNYEKNGTPCYVVSI